MTGSNPNDDAVIVALGANLPGRRGSVRDALEAALERFPAHGLTVAARSRWWRSSAWPDASAPAFLNGVVLVETVLSPASVLAALLAIEDEFGRRRGEPNAPRTLDLDLIAYGRQVLTGPTLSLPHPRAHQRRFVMGPLAELAPGWTHPVLGSDAAALLARAAIGADSETV